MFDPITIIGGLIAGLLAKRVAQAALFAALVAVSVSILYSILVSGQQLDSSGLPYVVIWIASVVWTFGAFAAKKALATAKPDRGPELTKSDMGDKEN